MNLKEYLNETVQTLESIKKCDKQINKAINECINALKNRNKIIIFGNGGSASDAQHFTAELVGKFSKERKGLPAIALTDNSSNLTAIANDFGYEKVFEKQIEALCNENDIAIGISTSGNSKNIILGLKKAKEMKAKTIALIGENDSLLKFSETIISIKEKKTYLIQLAHGAILHFIAKKIDDEFI
jgi:D-sedoheptulose 7-phosphate isomerase